MSTPEPPAPMPSAPPCECASRTPTYPVFRRAYHIPPCQYATRAQHDAADGARILREEEIPKEEQKWRDKGASERTIERLIGTMKAQAADLEFVALNGKKPPASAPAATPHEQHMAVMEEGHKLTGAYIREHFVDEDSPAAIPEPRPAKPHASWTPDPRFEKLAATPEPVRGDPRVCDGCGQTDPFGVVTVGYPHQCGTGPRDQA